MLQRRLIPGLLSALITSVLLLQGSAVYAQTERLQRLPAQGASNDMSNLNASEQLSISKKRSPDSGTAMSSSRSSGSQHKIGQIEIKSRNTITSDVTATSGGKISIGNTGIGRMDKNGNTDSGKKFDAGSTNDCIGEDCSKSNTEPKLYGTLCDDGKFCTSFDGLSPGPDKYAGGMCIGNNIQLNKGWKLTEKSSINIQEIANTIKNILSGFSKAGLCKVKAPSLKFTKAESMDESCCEDRNTISETEVVEVQISGAGGVSCTLSYRPVITAGLVAITGTLGAELKAAINGGYSINACDSACRSRKAGEFSLKVTGAPGLALLHPSVAHGQVGISGKGVFSLAFPACDSFNATSSGCLIPSVFVQVVLFGGLTKRWEWKDEKFSLCTA